MWEAALLPPLTFVCYCLLPTSPHGISLYLLPAPPRPILYVTTRFIITPISSLPVPLPPCITFKTLMFTFRSVCAPLLNLHSQLFYSSHFLLLSSDLFLQIPLQLEQTPSLRVPNTIPLFLFRTEAENSSYHLSMIPLQLKNTGDNQAATSTLLQRPA